MSDEPRFCQTARNRCIAAMVRLDPRRFNVTVYVDGLVAWGDVGRYRGRYAAQAEQVGQLFGHRWCHLFADEADCEELHSFARRLGLRREWFQRNHYDLLPPRRTLAVQLGALELTRGQSVAVWKKQRSMLPVDINEISRPTLGADK